jgi:hypothetical protein
LEAEWSHEMTWTLLFLSTRNWTTGVQLIASHFNAVLCLGLPVMRYHLTWSGTYHLKNKTSQEMSA